MEDVTFGQSAVGNWDGLVLPVFLKSCRSNRDPNSLLLNPASKRFSNNQSVFGSRLTEGPNVRINFLPSFFYRGSQTRQIIADSVMMDYQRPLDEKR